jgi:hypothetical protein
MTRKGKSGGDEKGYSPRDERVVRENKEGEIFEVGLKKRINLGMDQNCTRE